MSDYQYPSELLAKMIADLVLIQNRNDMSEAGKPLLGQALILIAEAHRLQDSEEQD